VTFSTNFVRAMVEQSTSQVFLWLMTLEHLESGTKHYIVNNLDSITSRGNVYTAFPFEFVLPEDDGNTLPEVQIAIRYVSDDLIQLIRQYADGLSITAEIVLASNPDAPEYSIDQLSVKSVDYDLNQIMLTAKVEDLLNQRFPADDFLPRSFAGMFK
jgi:hypothetical protein